jgi:4-amino-4-deoxychorismate lyase
MSLFIETIQILHGELNNLVFHQERFERTRLQALRLKKHPLLSEVIQIPTGLEQGIMKCRVLYDKDIVLIEYEPYQVRELHSLKMVYSDSIDYGFKYANRSELEELFRQREDCDDILVIKNGCVSDSFYANVVFWDGEGWITPDTPLLPGTMRASLLRKEEIRECRIRPEDLAGYQKTKLINAMNDLENAPEIPMKSIH